MILSAMCAHCSSDEASFSSCFQPKGNGAHTPGKHEQTEAFCVSGRVFSGGEIRDWPTVECRQQGSRAPLPPPLSALCRTPHDSRRVVVPARSKKAMRSTDKSAQRGLETGIRTNRLRHNEASSPRYGSLEEEGSWK